MTEHIKTICAHAGATPDPSTGAVTSPLYFSSTFHYPPTGEYPLGHIYSRESNPTRASLETVLAQLEQGEDAAAFSSGSAAASAVFLSLRPSDHIIINFDAYAGIRAMLKDVFMPWGLDVTFTDLSDVSNLSKSIQPNTKLVWTESPTNPQLRIVDLASVIGICKQKRIKVAVDNTFATPALQNPLALGADIVMHSTTKYLGGHSDLTGGALITAKKDEQWERIRHIQHIQGAIPAPFDCWLLLRGIRSFVPRMMQHISNAKAVAEFLSQHPKVERVLYPGLITHPGHAIAKHQMSDFGAMVSFLVRGTKEDAIKIAQRVKVFTNATSLGGTESLLEHRKSVEGPDSPTPENLLRLSVGIEDVNSLIEDLKQALS
ncbi:MAG: aminotransferase class V-fold PLP-dependent enzyme [Chryseotalea sp. WA131a]|jgi:cystathionine gamma-synthase|nr:MAG: aminotransferase class V-fold PLP-dependent enzyme [Chryseotalea sp. WA131a]